MERPGPNRWQRFSRMVMNNLLTILLVIGVVLGCVLGIIISITSGPISKRESEYLSFIGILLIRMLKCDAVPLILSCVVVALGSLDLYVSSTLGWQLMVYVFVTKLLSSGIGIIVGVLAQPGKVGKYAASDSGIEASTTLADIFLDMVRNFIPPNLIRMLIQHEQTKLKGNNTDPKLLKIDVRFEDNANLLGVIIVAIIIGLCLSILRERGKGLLKFSKQVYKVSMKLAIWILWTAPVCLFFLILAEFLRIQNFVTFFTTWGIFIITVYGVFCIIFLIMYPLILILLGKINVIKLYRDIWSALLTGFVTASSLATIPVLIECLLKNGVDERVVDFVVPIGVNINKDGTAGYLSVITMFVAQATDEDLSAGHYVSIWILGTFGSIATPAVPFSGVVILIMILNGLGMKQDLIGEIMVVDWINDRGQTLVNIAGNAVAAKLIEKWNMKFLVNKDERDEED